MRHRGVYLNLWGSIFVFVYSMCIPRMAWVVDSLFTEWVRSILFTSCTSGFEKTTAGKTLWVGPVGILPRNETKTGCGVSDTNIQ